MNTLVYAFKDLKSQRIRAIMGIVGVAISIFLLSSVSFLTDSVSNAYVDYLTTNAGGVDVDIHQRELAGGQQNLDSYFNYTAMIEKVKNVTNEVENFIPRNIDSFSVNYSNTNNVFNFYFIGLNVSLEKQIQFGKITNTTYDFETKGIPKGECAITQALADDMGLKMGDTLNISRWRYDNGTTRPNYYMNLTICSIFTPILKFPSEQTEVAVVDLKDIPYDYNYTWGHNDTYSVVGRVNHLYLTLKNSESLYDIRNIPSSEEKVEAIGAAIQLQIGYGYWVDLPKLEQLDGAQFLSVGTTMIFVVIGLIAMLISSILISGILSTSVEERIREFGIFRTLGAHKGFNLKLVIYQGLLLCMLGTTIGVFGSALLMSRLIPFVSRFIPETVLTKPLQFVPQPTSFITSYLIGIGVSMIVSISPAIKVARMQIVQSINPYRHEEKIYKLIREQTVNVKVLLFGALLAINGGVTFFLIPKLMASMNLTLIVTAMIVLLLVFLIGLTMAGFGLIPLLLRFWIFIFRPFTRKIINVISVTIFRHQRRNNSTILMFCLSFSFIMFSTSMINIQMNQVSALIEFNRGAPLVLYRSGTGLKTPTVDLQQQLMQIQGVEKTSIVIANPTQLSQMYSEDGKKFGAALGDYIDMNSENVTIFGVDDNYINTVFTKFNHFMQGNSASAFEQLYNGSNTCIISGALSEQLSLNLNDHVRLSFIRGDEQSNEEFVIVGVADKLSGFSQFKSSSIMGSSNGVLISKNNYIKYMQIPNPAWVYKIFINISPNYTQDTDIVDKNIKQSLGDNWNFRIVNVALNVADMRSTFALVQLIMEAILSFTIIICMFGLFASTYASILERKREIGILRALGLKRDGVEKIFTIESLIIMLASGMTGTIVGYITAALLTRNLVIFTDSPSLISFPWAGTILLFTISIIVLLIGMKLLLKKVKKQNLIEIFRATT